MATTDRRLPYVAGALAIVLWGTTPAVTMLVARDLAPALIGPARLLLSALLILPVVLALRPAYPRRRAGWTALVVNGIFGFGASFLLQGVGIANTTTSHAALVLATAPVITGLVQYALSRRWPQRLWWAGSTAALIGEAILILGRLGSARGDATMAGDLIVLLGTVTVSIGYVAGARLSAQIGLFGATAWSILFGAAFMLPTVPFLAAALPALTAPSAGALLFLALLCTLIGFAAWFWALDQGGVASIALLQFAQPVVSLIIAVSLLAEETSATLIIALVLILGGVYLCRRAVSREPGAAVSRPAQATMPAR